LKREDKRRNGHPPLEKKKKNRVQVRDWGGGHSSRKPKYEMGKP